MDWLGLLIALLLAALFYLLFAGPLRRMEQEEVRKIRRMADEQFFALQVPSTHARLSFNGLQARIVKDEERYWQNEHGFHYELTRYACNEAGEYFMFAYNPDGKPFFKHVEPRIAKVVLKDLYCEPS